MEALSPIVPLERQSAWSAAASCRQCVTCPVGIPDSDPDWTKQCGDCFRDQRTRRPCKVCNQHRIPVTEPEWKKVCGSCFKNAAMRPCTSCKEYKIKSFDPAWRVLCQDCFSQKKWTRTCQMCKDRPIRDEMPSYVTMCTKCYLENKKKTHDHCPTCTGERAKLMTRRIGAPACRECMLGKGLIKTMDTTETV